MPDTTLSPTGLVQIEVGASEDSWGEKLNENAAILNALLEGVAGGVKAFPVSPTISTDNVAPTGVAYATQFGAYARLGPFVVVSVRVELTSKGTGGTGQPRILNLPFAAAAECYVSALQADNLVGGDTGNVPAAVISLATTFAQMRFQGANVTPPMDWSNITNSSKIRFTAIYLAT